jgi:Apea-like HEPN
MSLDGLKIQLGLLLSAAVEAAVSAGRELGQVRGTALYDSRKDLFITSLDPFAAVEAGVRDLELVHERYGVDQSHRIALQLVYEYFARAKGVLLDSALVDALWTDFVAELETPVWLTRCVTNLRHFRCENLHVELGEGVSIYGRDRSVLAGLGFDDGIWERLAADWSGFGASSFVLVAETSISKRPDNFITLDNGGGWLRCARAIGAMRLIASGDVGISAMFVQRVARFNVGIGGIHSTGSTVDTIGSPYTWRPERRPLYDGTYTALAHLEKIGYGNAPGNLDLALRAFMSTFDRFPTAMDTKLVDSITALEAVLGSETEIAFKLSFRVASLLAATDEERSTLLKAVKGFYDARSRIVHGGRLGKKQSASLAAVDDLRNIVRRLLRSFVVFAADRARHVDKRFFAEELDAALVDASRREHFRELLGLAESTSPNAVLSDRAG